MPRGLGCALILAGSMMGRGAYLARARSAQRLRRELSAALCAAAEEIRLLLTPLPRLLRRGGYGTMADAFFRSVTQGISEGSPLRESWRSAAGALPLPEEERATLMEAGDRLGGTEEGVCAALTLCAIRLRDAYDREAESYPACSRLATALCLSLGGLLCIVLW